MRTGIFLLTWALAAFLAPLLASAEIRHLELGAANYGLQYGNSSDRFKVLDETLADLVKEYGESGVVYLNDIDREGLILALHHAKRWLQVRGLENIRVEPLLGDYTEIHIPLVKTAHLSNPGWDQLPNANTLKELNDVILEELESLAARSETGLKISSYFYYDGGSRKESQNYMGIIASLVKDSVLIATGEPGYAYHAPGVQMTHLKFGPPKLFILISKIHFCARMLDGRGLKTKFGAR